VVGPGILPTDRSDWGERQHHGRRSRFRVSPPDGGYFPVSVSVDPWQATVLSSKSALGERIFFWMLPLRTGDGLGFIYCLVVFLVGLLPMLFTITDVMI
jgi:hypothetical protein